MRRPLKLTGLILVGLLIAIQFIQPKQNLSEQMQENDMLFSMAVPAQVAKLLKNSCYDCHSEYTHYPWYSRISPVSWLLNRHVEEGKEALNFNDYAGLKERKKIGILSSLCEVLELGSMPLPGYLIIHQDAVLGDEEIAEICDWSESEALKIMQSGDAP